MILPLNPKKTKTKGKATSEEKNDIKVKLRHLAKIHERSSHSKSIKGKNEDESSIEWDINMMTELFQAMDRHKNIISPFGRIIENKNEFKTLLQSELIDLKALNHKWSSLKRKYKVPVQRHGDGMERIERRQIQIQIVKDGLLRDRLIHEDPNMIV